MRARTLLPCLLVTLLLTSGDRAAASSFGIESVTAYFAEASQESRGYRFRAEDDLLVTELALFDVQSDGIGLEGFYHLRLWTDVGEQIAVASLPFGSDAPLVDGFRLVDIPDVLLAAGEIYRLSVDFGDGAGGDELVVGFAQIVTHASFTLLNNTSNQEAGLDDFGLIGTNDGFPDSPNTAMLGPNIVFTVVPEPGTALQLGLGLALVGWRSRSSRSRRR